METWCDWHYPESSTNKTTARASPCVQCRQARDLCAAAAGIDLSVYPESLLSSVKLFTGGEISLGCFNGAVLDRCCDDACGSRCELTRRACIRSSELNWDEPLNEDVCALYYPEPPQRCQNP